MKSQKVKLALVRGMPGSGKSSVAKMFAAKYGLLHFENDAYLYVDGKYVWTPARQKAAAKQCFKDTVAALKAGKSVIVSNVFPLKKSLQRYVRAGEAAGASIAVFRVVSMYQNVHNVPDCVLADMQSSFEAWPNEVMLKSSFHSGKASAIHTPEQHLSAGCSQVD